MGKVGNFRAWLIWVIKQETIEKVKQGLLGVKKKIGEFVATIVPDRAKLMAQMKERIAERRESVEIKAVRLRILEKVGSGAYASWFERVEVEAQEESLVIRGQNRFMVEKLRDQFRETLRTMWADVTIERGGGGC